jgi:4-amino-4-deoxy-L-arabinose transferase-like glycosyltransferase
VNPPSPALVAQSAVRRLPRWVLLLLCAAYIVPGYVGRNPWKNADITAFGVMRELAAAPNWQAWLAPAHMDPSDAALLPYWLGAWVLQITQGWIAPELAARLPFMLMLAGTLAAVWGAVAHLARHASAQPVAFAFGGEADPKSYARALADGALLALIATLGLAQFSHETAPALAQLFCVALLFYGLAALPFKLGAALAAAAFGLVGLTLSGASGTALIIGAIATAGMLRVRPGQMTGQRRAAVFITLLIATAICALLAWRLDWWRWQPALPLRWVAWRDRVKLLIWFTWPAWPLVLWTLWRWRRQILAPHQNWHLSLPVMLACVPLASATFGSGAPDRSLLLALPGLAALAAFALPTFRRRGAAFIDWFTVLFFTGWAIFIWVMWLATLTGFPPQPAVNVARLAPGFHQQWQWPGFIAALAGTLAWVWIVRWRAGRHRAALWKSLVLPAAGATLCWLLLMTLWLPAFDYARSYAAQMRQVQAVIGDGAPCVQVQGLTSAQIAALRFHGGWTTVQPSSPPACPWLLRPARRRHAFEASAQGQIWQRVANIRHPVNRQEALSIYRQRGEHDEDTATAPASAPVEAPAPSPAPVR